MAEGKNRSDRTSIKNEDPDRVDRGLRSACGNSPGSLVHLFPGSDHHVMQVVSDGSPATIVEDTG